MKCLHVLDILYVSILHVPEMPFVFWSSSSSSTMSANTLAGKPAQSSKPVKIAPPNTIYLTNLPHYHQSDYPSLLQQQPQRVHHATPCLSYIHFEYRLHHLNILNQDPTAYDADENLLSLSEASAFYPRIDCIFNLLLYCNTHRTGFCLPPHLGLLEPGW